MQIRIRLINLIVFLSVFDAYSQVSYRMRVDSMLTLPGFRTSRIISCADHGLAISGICSDTSNSPFFHYSFVMKTDSSGMLEWSKKYRGFDNYKGTLLVPTSDTGMYFNSEELDIMFAQYTTPILHRLDKAGNVLYVMAGGGGLGSNPSDALANATVEKYSDRLWVSGQHYDYDPITEEPCCYEGFLCQFDTNLNVMNKYGGGLIHFTYDDNQTPFFVVSGQGYNSHSVGIRVLDTSGTHIETHYYAFDSLEVKAASLVQYQDHKGYRYMLDLARVGQSNRLAIHKTDSAWNTVYFTVIDTGLTIPNNNYFQKIKLGISADDRMLISMLLKPGNDWTLRAFMLELDLSGNVQFAWISSDSLYVDNYIDTISGTALFLRSALGPGNWYSPMDFERQYPSVPSCNYSSVNSLSFQATVTDSVDGSGGLNFMSGNWPVFGAALPAVPFPVNSFFQDGCNLTPLIESETLKICNLHIWPNPGRGLIQFSSDCQIKPHTVFSIVNAMGQLVCKFPVSDEQFSFSLDTWNWPSGIYLVSMSVDGSVIQRRFLIQ